MREREILDFSKELHKALEKQLLKPVLKTTCEEKTSHLRDHFINFNRQMDEFLMYILYFFETCLQNHLSTMTTMTLLL